MKVIRAGDQVVMVELTRRNLTVLLAKLDDLHSARTIVAPTGDVVIRAVEDIEHYADREPGPMLVNGELI